MLTGSASPPAHESDPMEEAALNTLLPIAAAQQTAPPSTAAGIEADLKSGMFSEDEGPAANKE